MKTITKEVNVVMLATEGKGALELIYPQDPIQVGSVSMPSSFKHEPQHLYFTSDEGIQNGDWCINSEVTKDHEEYNMVYKFEGEQYAGTRKIIATTDTNLHWEESSGQICPLGLTDSDKYVPDVPQIPQSFIESYVKNPVEAVLLEYEEYE